MSKSFLLGTSVCQNKDLVKTYAHSDCVAFADILHWSFLDKGLTSEIIMAGSATNNHFYVKVKDEKGCTFFCDAYGVFDSQKPILERYGFEIEDTEVVEDWEDNDL